MKRLSPYFYAAPALVILLVFIYWPIVYSLWLSLHRWDFLMPEPRFLGLENYRVMLGEENFRAALWRTALFTLVSVVPKLALALFVAILIADPSRPNRILRSVFFLPVVMSSVAIGVVFSWMMSTEIGLFNRTLVALGLHPVRWLTDPDFAIYSIAIVEVWKWFGYDVVIYAAGLQAIPLAFYEAARMDGAGPWRKFRDITFPLIMPTTFFLVILSVINGFQVYTFIDVMTGGGPARATEVVLYYLIRVGFDSANIGLGSAVAVFLFVVLVAITLLKFVFVGRRVHYGYD